MVDAYNHVKHCTTHPKFLHSNSTSHRWVFGAIAELIDNAIDPDVSASQFCIDMKEFNGEPCLVFMDNGCGLVPEKLHKMLSFGHSKKQMAPGDRSIGKHGNGFKSGTMRLGKDVLVLTKCANSMTAGFLSQTFLADTGAEDILIPQVSWDLTGKRMSPMDLEIEESLRAICKFSIFPDEDSLLAQLEAIPVTGAILIISNLRRHEGVLELDFETDPHDIRITSEINSSHFQQLRPNQPNTTEVPMDYSLRAYVSILYKVPRMQIFIRDKKVKTKRIAGILSQKETESYKPYGVAESIKIELGFNTEDKNLYGMMLYHRNRLIKAYMRVGMQLEENERGMGVIGLAEADFLQPTHNKQDFDDTTAYRRLLKKLADVLSEYWWEKKERVHGSHIPLVPRALRLNVSSAEDVPDVIWVQCDNPACLKWRILPAGTDATALPDIWYCEFHPDEKFRRHEEPEQEWDPSVQHEIIERRKERKREYDREKKEREAERKRQRLEAATRDSQEALQRQRDALAKEVQVREAQEELAQKEHRRLEEEMKKLNEEYASMEAKRDKLLKEHKEFESKLQLAQEELASKAIEKEETALLSAQEVHLEVEAAEGSIVPTSSRPVMENGHDDNTSCRLGNTLGESLRIAERPLERQKVVRLTDRPLYRVALNPLLPSSSHVHKTPLELNGDSHVHEDDEAPSRMILENSHPAAVPSSSHLESANGVQASQSPRGGRRPAVGLWNARLAAAVATSPLRNANEAQASQPLRSGRTSLVGLTKELTTRGVSASRHVHRRGAVSSASARTNNLQGASAEHWKRPSKASQRSQPAGIQLSPEQEPQPPSQRVEIIQRVPSPEALPDAVAHMPPTSSLGCSPSLDASPTPVLQEPGPALRTVSGYIPANSQQSMQPPTSSLEQRSSLIPDAAHQDLPSPTQAANGSFDRGPGNLCTEAEGVEQQSKSHHFGVMGNAQHADSDYGASLSGLRLAMPEEQMDMALRPGLLSVHLPMDSMVSNRNSRSEAELTLDKAVFSLQRRLRLALNTLVRLGGSVDSSLFELDVLPSEDGEVVSICEKAKMHVETRMQNYRQEVASLKAELAYLMADKMQHGQGWNFKIQSVASKWGIGVDVSKRS